MSDKYANQKPTVSLITVTQYSRRACLTNLIELIREQIYDTIVEWVIVEGSQDQADADANQLYLASQYNAIESLPLNVVYIPYEEDQSHLCSLFGEDSIYKNEVSSQELIWPTTRQGDEHEERIKYLEDKLRRLEEQVARMESRQWEKMD